MGTEVILAHHLALDGLETIVCKIRGGKLVGFVIIAICTFDELAILHLLRGAIWPAIQTGPVMTSLCFRNGSSN